MEWSEGHVWTLLVGLTKGLTDFKCVVMQTDDSIGFWEPGANRVVDVSENHS